MTAPRLSLDHARSFEVPCWFGAIDAVLSVGHDLEFGRGWAAEVRLGLQTVWLGRDGSWGEHFGTLASFPTAQEALDAAFATEQIEPRGDDR